MGYGTLMQIIAMIIIGGLLSKTVAPSVIKEIKNKKIEKIIETENVIVEAISRYIEIKNITPNNINDLINENLIEANILDNGFEGTYSFILDSNKGIATIVTEIADIEARTNYINSYKNIYKPEIITGNTLHTNFVLPTTVMHGGTKIQSNIPTQATPPSAITNKLWYDTSGLYAILKMSDGTNWKTISTKANGGNNLNIGSINNNGTNDLTYSSEITNGDIKYVYDSVSDQLEKYSYYNGSWYNLNNSGNINNIGNACDDGNALTTNDQIKITGICKGRYVELFSDLYPGINTSNISNFFYYNDKLYFTATAGTVGNELYVFDGTSISLVKDLYVGTNSSFLSPYQIYNNKLLLIGKESAILEYIYLYDGINLEKKDYIYSIIMANIIYKNKVYLTANLNDTGEELYSYTEENGLTLVSDINIGSTHSNPMNYTIYNNKLYFTATTESKGRELYSYDGISISLVSDIYSGSSSSNPQFLTIYNNKLFFAATTGSKGIELYSYDGISVSLVSDINKGTNSSIPSNLYVFKEKLYFMANDGILGYELYSYNDKTVSLVSDINIGVNSSYPGRFKEYNNKLYFTAENQIIGEELYVYDEKNISLVKDINLGSNAGATGPLIVYKNKLYFKGNNGITGWELFVLEDEL